MNNEYHNLEDDLRRDRLYHILIPRIAYTSLAIIIVSALLIGINAAMYEEKDARDSTVVADRSSTTDSPTALPQTIRVFDPARFGSEVVDGETISVRLVDHIPCNFEDMSCGGYGGGYYVGEYVLDDNQILILKGEGETGETLLHETLHAALRGRQPATQKLTEEEWIRRTSPRLQLILSRNPGLVRYIVTR